MDHLHGHRTTPGSNRRRSSDPRHGTTPATGTRPATLSSASDVSNRPRSMPEMVWQRNNPVTPPAGSLLHEIRRRNESLTPQPAQPTPPVAEPMAQRRVRKWRRQRRTPEVVATAAPNVPALAPTTFPAPIRMTAPPPARTAAAPDRPAPRRHRAATASQGHHRASQEILASRHRPPGSGLAPTRHRRHSRAVRRRGQRWQWLRFCRLMRQVAMLCLLAGCGYGVFFALTAPEWQIKSVRVEGLKSLEPAAVESLAQGLEGQNVFRARTRPVVAALHQLAPVQEARVVRNLSWPPQVTVRILERQPVARVGAGENWWVSDASGLPFRPAGAGDDMLPAITGPRLLPTPGQVLPEEAWQPAREFLQALEVDAAQGPQWTTRRIYFDRHGFVSLRLSDPTHREMLIRLGSDQWPEKLIRARQALQYFETSGRRAAALNLISFSRPTWTPVRQARHTPAEYGEAAAGGDKRQETNEPPSAEATGVPAPPV